MDTFRVKEFTIGEDATNTWFYPQLLVKKRVNTGMWWWKKRIIEDEWQLLYNFNGKAVNFSDSQAEALLTWAEQKSVIGFKTLVEAENWIKEESKKTEKLNQEISDKVNKYMASRMTHGEKIHQVNLK